jgi:hypothetical protein
MKFKIIALLASAAIGMAFVQVGKEEKPVKPAQENVAADWTPLFDGKTFAGWSKYGGGEVGKAWKIENGELYLDGPTRQLGKKVTQEISSLRRSTRIFTSSTSGRSLPKEIVG